MDKLDKVIIAVSIILCIIAGVCGYYFGKNSKIQKLESELQNTKHHLQLMVQYRGKYDRCVTDKLPNLDEME